MRRILVLLHRWLGLFMALFLCLAGLTGAVIAWDHELDRALNPEFYLARASDAKLEPVAALAVAARVEAADPRLRVRYLPLSAGPGEALTMFVAPRTDPATGQPFALGFDQMAVDPASGEVQATRRWGEASLRRQSLVPFIYKLHYSLHLPAAFGLDTGVLLMGLVAMVWALDAFIALWISFPSRKAWRRSFAFRFRQGGHKLTFDLHRSGGVWLWGLLLIMAVTAVSMNLGRQVVRPIVGLFSTLTPEPFDAPPPAAPAPSPITRERAVELAVAEASRQGLAAPPGGLLYSPEFGLYGIGLFAPHNEHGDGGLGNAWLYFDDREGAPAGAQVPGKGSAGDIFMQAQFPLHSGRILGVPGRILVSALGLAIATLSITGVLLWARKRRARKQRDEQDAQAGAGDAEAASGGAAAASPAEVEVAAE